jgi:hypothetical protein
MGASQSQEWPEKEELQETMEPVACRRTRNLCASKGKDCGKSGRNVLVETPSESNQGVATLTAGRKVNPGGEPDGDGFPELRPNGRMREALGHYTERGKGSGWSGTVRESIPV